jgi:hypothetical protein
MLGKEGKRGKEEEQSCWGFVTLVMLLKIINAILILWQSELSLMVYR